ADGSVLVLAGYIAPFEKWEKFSVDWKKLLDGPPRWERFKMAEVASTKDAQRWERAAAFYRVIEDCAEAFVAVAVELEPLKRAAAEAGFADGRLTNPYIFAHRAIMDATIQYQDGMGINEPVDFIFDAFTHHEDFIRAGWEVFKEHIQPDLKERVGREPRFET